MFEDEKENIKKNLKGIDETKASDVFNSKEYNKNLEDIKKNISNKLKNIGNRIVVLNTQVEFVEKAIKSKQNVLERMNPENITGMRKMEQSIIYSIEISGKIHESIIKYENLIQSYTKNLTDIENNKLTAYTKIRTLDKEEIATDKEYVKMMKELHDSLNHNMNSGNGGDYGASLLHEAANSLSIGGYGAPQFLPNGNLKN